MLIRFLNFFNMYGMFVSMYLRPIKKKQCTNRRLSRNRSPKLFLAWNAEQVFLKKILMKVAADFEICLAVKRTFYSHIAQYSKAKNRDLNWV